MYIKTLLWSEPTQSMLPWKCHDGVMQLPSNWVFINEIISKERVRVIGGWGGGRKVLWNFAWTGGPMRGIIRISAPNYFWRRDSGTMPTSAKQVKHFKRDASFSLILHVLVARFYLGMHSSNCISVSLSMCVFVCLFTRARVCGGGHILYTFMPI